MPLYLKMSENINETTRHLSRRFMGVLDCLHDATTYVLCSLLCGC